MELNGKQKSTLRSLAQTLKPVFQVGKDGIDATFLANVRDYLLKHELLKVTLLQTNPMELEEVKAQFVSQGIHIVQEIGNQLLLYKRNPKIKDGIKLPR